MTIRILFRAISIFILSMPVLTAAAAEPSLKEIMQDLRDNLVEITDGLLVGDFDRVMRGATGIAEHAPISAPQAKRIVAELGPEMPAFKQFDEQVHTVSESLARVATEKDRDAMNTNYQEIVNGCLGCHAAFKDRVGEILNRAP